MKIRITEKIEEIRIYLNELSSILPCSLIKYTKEIKEKAACERYVEKIMEAVTDLAYLIIRHNNFNKPNDDSSAYSILHENKIINKEMLKKLKSSKGMKNIISHQDGGIDDEIIFEAIKEELPTDIEEFLKAVENKI